MVGCGETCNTIAVGVGGSAVRVTVAVNVGRGVNVILGVNVIVAVAVAVAVGTAVGTAVGRRVGGGFWTAELCEIAEIFGVEGSAEVGGGPSPAPKSVVKKRPYGPSATPIPTS